jgi:hypothetical protein
MRFAGSENFTVKYHPDFPRVRIKESVPCHTVTVEQLESLGLVTPPEPMPEPLTLFRASSSKSQPPRIWSSYRQALERAPLARNHRGRDRSMADVTWCMTAIDLGFSAEAVAERLLEESEKPRIKGRGYARQTARDAQSEVEKNRQGQGWGRA